MLGLFDFVTARICPNVVGDCHREKLETAIQYVLTGPVDFNYYDFGCLRKATQCVFPGYAHPDDSREEFWSDDIFEAMCRLDLRKFFVDTIPYYSERQNFMRCKHGEYTYRLKSNDEVLGYRFLMCNGWKYQKRSYAKAAIEPFLLNSMPTIDPDLLSQVYFQILDEHGIAYTERDKLEFETKWTLFVVTGKKFS